ILFRAAYFENEISQNLRAPLGVQHFGMEFDAVKMPRAVFDGGDSVVGASSGFESVGQASDMIAMAVPHFQMLGKTSKERGIFFAVERRGAVFPALRFHDVSAERSRHPLHAVTDAEHGNAEAQNFGVARRRIDIVHRTGAAGEDDAARLEALDFVERGVAGQNRGEDLLLADSPRDQLRVLTAEIQHHNSAARAQSGGFVFRRQWLLLRNCRGICHPSTPWFAESSAQSDYCTTIFTSFRGTTIVLMIFLPTSSCAMRGSWMARSTTSSSPMLSSTKLLPRTRPLI